MWWVGALEKDAVAVEDATRVAIVAVLVLDLLLDSEFVELAVDESSFKQTNVWLLAFEMGYGLYR